MRGAEPQQAVLFSYRSIEERTPADHPLRPMRAMVNAILAALSPRFDAMYAAGGRPSIPPEHLLRASILQVLFTIRSERQLMEQLDYNLLYRWFVGLNADDVVWDASTFSKNQQRLLAGNVAEAFFHAVLAGANAARLLSHEHFTVDGTLLAAWASHTSVRRKDDPSPPDSDGDPKNPSVNFRGETRTNATHHSVTDPDARLARKGDQTGAMLAHLGSVTMENRNGLVVSTDVRPPSGVAEREAAVDMLTTLEPRGALSDPSHRRTAGLDKAYDQRSFVADLRELGVTPHVAQNDHATHPSAINARTTRHAGYEVSQRKRKLVEQAFGWVKEIGGLRRLKYRGTLLVQFHFTFRMAIYNLVRMRTLSWAGAG